MGILIFGTGGSTELYLEDNKEYFKNIDILAFVDNDKSKIGGQFKNKEIISPSDIFKYDFDIILICSVYEEEIYNQLVDKIKVLKQNIYTKRTYFENIIFPWYDKIYNLYNKKVLIVSEDAGTEQDYRKYFGRNYNLLNIIGIISLDEIYLISRFQYDFILISNFKPIPLQNEYTMRENVIFEMKKNNYKIDGGKILTNEVLNVYLRNINEFSFGENYTGKSFLLIRPGHFFAGLGDIAITIAIGIQLAKRKGFIPVVDMQTYQTQYLDNYEYGSVNAYTKFFKQPDMYELEDILEAKSVYIMYVAKWFSKEEERKIIFPEMQDELYEKFYRFKKKFNNKKVLGVLFRGTDYSNLKPYGHNIQPDLNSMIQSVKDKIIEWGGFDFIYLCTEVHEACIKFEEEFGKEKVCYYPQLRFSSDTKKYLADISLGNGEHTEQGRGYYIALNCLALCNSLVAGQCTGTRVALIINNFQYENLYLFNLGRYGIDDI